MSSVCGYNTTNKGLLTFGASSDWSELYNIFSIKQGINIWMADNSRLTELF